MVAMNVFALQRCILLCFLVGVAAAQGQQIDERRILLEFYEATGGHAWNQNLGWANGSVDICNWFGVVCEEAQTDNNDNNRRTQQQQRGKVLGLQLPDNFLTGRTPASLWTLPALASVDLSYNPHLEVDFTGLQKDDDNKAPLTSLKLRNSATTSLVGLLGASDTLEELDLAETRLDSRIPADLFALTNLRSITMAECGLLGSLPNDIERLSVLREMDFFGNSLTGTLPTGLARLVHLRQLSLSYNQFRGTLPAYLNDFIMMREFYAHDNEFVGSIPSFSRAPEIKKISLHHNALTGTIPVDFLQATRGSREKEIIHVNFASNALTGGVPESLDNLEDINMVWMLGDNQWTGVPETLCDNENWNEGSIAAFSCFGFLCPPRSFSRHGFQTSDSPCQPCDSAEFFGATNCFDKDDRGILVELYEELQGENWGRSDNWLKDDDVCTWYGVECWSLGDAKDGRVRRILLPNNGLVGTVPGTIYSIQHLTTLDFSRNEIILPFDNIEETLHLFSINVAATRTKDFDGIENAEINFHELYADQTPISGGIPTEIYGIQSLQVLSLQNCDLSGEISEEIFRLTSLHELYLSDNDLRGSIPDRWDELRNLTVLALAKNRFRGSFPASIGGAPRLAAVSLQDQTTKGGGLTGDMPSLATTTSIRKLLLADNSLEGDLPEDLLTSVEGDVPLTVDLSNNLITGKIHGTYDRFKRMNLYLEGNFITELDKQLCAQANWMQGNVGEYGCDAILCPPGTKGGRHAYIGAPCESCSGAERNGSLLGQSTCNRDASDLSERDILELLYDKCGGPSWHAKDNWMTAGSVCNWYGISCDESGSVTSIQLGGNRLVGFFPTEIYLLPNLMHLKLYSNTVNFSFEGIENAKNLKSLGLDNTGLSSVKGIGRARSLEEVNLSYNQLEGTLSEEMSRLVNVRLLDISRNQLSGNLPYWLRSLVSLTALTASYNRFSGPVFDFSNFSDLVYLDLSHNKLTGSVPATLFASAPENQKLVVDLSANSLSGQVPAELSRLPRLSLQVQDNQITGIHPDICELDGWNDNSVGDYGCNAILCPAGTWNALGRQSTEETPCAECRRSKYMGSTHCGNSSGATHRVGSITVYLASTLSLLMFLI